MLLLKVVVVKDLVVWIRDLAGVASTSAIVVARGCGGGIGLRDKFKLT